jgi:chromosome segregation ATPase
LNALSSAIIAAFSLIQPYEISLGTFRNWITPKGFFTATCIVGIFAVNRYQRNYCIALNERFTALTKTVETLTQDHTDFTAQLKLFEESSNNCIEKSEKAFNIIESGKREFLDLKRSVVSILSDQNQLIKKIQVDSKKLADPLIKIAEGVCTGIGATQIASDTHGSNPKNEIALLVEQGKTLHALCTSYEERIVALRQDFEKTKTNHSTQVQELIKEVSNQEQLLKLYQEGTQALKEEVAALRETVEQLTAKKLNIIPLQAVLQKDTSSSFMPQSLLGVGQLN